MGAGRPEGAARGEARHAIVLGGVEVLELFERQAVGLAAEHADLALVPPVQELPRARAPRGPLSGRDTPCDYSRDRNPPMTRFPDRPYPGFPQVCALSIRTRARSP